MCMWHSALNTMTNNLVILIVFTYVFLTTQGRRQCGQLMTRTSPAKLQAKIIGGYEIGYYKYPWFAALQVEDDTLCGGALIGDNVVLSAAHCFDAAKGDLEGFYEIKLGLYRQCEKEPTQTKYKVTKVWLHEKWKTNRPYYDIALIKIAGNTKPYMPICLPPKDLTDLDQEPEGWIAGFGQKVDGNEESYPCEMNEGRILLYNHARCKRMVQEQKEGPKYDAFTNALCAGYESGTIDTCVGDSGGPLMTFDSLINSWQTVGMKQKPLARIYSRMCNGHFVQGITAFGWGCGLKHKMGIYTDVSKYLKWIEEKTDIKPSDYRYSKNDNDDNNHYNNNDKQTSTDNQLVNTFMSIYEHIMSSPHRPVDITIHFKKKPTPNIT